MAEFEFMKVSDLKDGDLTLKLVDTLLPSHESGLSPEYFFHMFKENHPEKIGYINVRIGKSERLYYAGLIGYGVDERHRGNQYAARACKLVLPVFRHHMVTSVIVTCPPGNIASRRTLEIAGAHHLGDVKVPEWHPAYERGVFVMSRFEIVLH